MQASVTLEKDPQLKSGPDQMNPWSCLWGIFLIADWCGGAQPAAASTTLGQEDWARMIKEGSWTSQGKQAGKQHSSIVSDLVPDSKILQCPLPRLPLVVDWNLEANKTLSSPKFLWVLVLTTATNHRLGLTPPWYSKLITSQNPSLNYTRKDPFTKWL